MLFMWQKTTDDNRDANTAGRVDDEGNALQEQVVYVTCVGWQWNAFFFLPISSNEAWIIATDKNFTNRAHSEILCLYHDWKKPCGTEFLRKHMYGDAIHICWGANTKNTVEMERIQIVFIHTWTKSKDKRWIGKMCYFVIVSRFGKE